MQEAKTVLENKTVIGVTGHRDLRRQDIPVLREAVRTVIEKLKAENSGRRLVMLDSIASGADTLCAEEAVSLGIPLICPLPMDADEYRKDFSGTELNAFDDLLTKADEVFVSPHFEPEKQGCDYLYRQAGIYVAAHSDILIALWDGSEAKPDGCGTAETVRFMLDGYFRDADEGERSRAVIHILTPREKSENGFAIEVKLIEIRS